MSQQQLQVDSHAPASRPRPKRFRHPVGPKLRKVLYLVFALFAVLGVNSVYLVAVRILEWQTGEVYQNWFFLNMFLLHLVLGLMIIVPVIVFGIAHMRNTYNRPNRRAVRVGYALFTTAIVLLISGLVLMRPGTVVTDLSTRSIAYWLHVITPLLAVWLYVLHRLAGRRIKWKLGLTWAAVAGGFAAILLVIQAQDPRAWNVIGPKQGEQYFFPSLARTSTGNFIPANVLDNNEYCLECHADIHNSWAHSVHRFSSFNNPPYLFSVKNTRKAMMERDGSVQSSRWCAGCHDPVPFFSGQFDDPKFDDPNYDLASDATAQAGITCTVCHAISHVNSVKGNADYTIDEPIHYPFAFSDNPMLKWVNRQLIKAKPEFHKETFLKPLHSSTEFCSTCHKVHLPPELNDYKWLRGQNHHDAFWLSGVSGQGVTSFYYPPKAETNCNGCHMPLMEVHADSAHENFAARTRDDSGLLKTLDHQFPSANTAIPYLVRDKVADYEQAIANHQEFLEGVMRVDIFGVREGGRIDDPLVAPIGPQVPALEPGNEYLFETVIRTLKMGHVFTQGTIDSNEVWMDVTVTLRDEDGQEQVIGRSGGRDPEDNAVDPWSHYVNAFVIDRYGNRINRRNPEDIFVPLYNNQIPPGAGEIVHYLLRLPPEARGSVVIDAKLQYRKFDTEYMRLVEDDPDTPELEPYYNDLPITTLAEDTVTLPIGTTESQALVEAAVEDDSEAFPLWQRWNDYGIGLLRRGQLRQAEQAFMQVEALGYPDGAVNLARVYIEEGRVSDDAPAALQRARDWPEISGTDRKAYEWSLLWFSGQVNKQNGRLDEAIANFKQIIEGGFEQAQGRNFDFSKDYRLLNTLADTLYSRGLRERGEANRPQRVAYMQEAVDFYQQALAYDPENATAHYGLQRVYSELGNDEAAARHTELHQKYKIDDNARDTAIANARRKYPAANHAAERTVIYDLQRSGAYELSDEMAETDENDSTPTQDVARHE